MKRFPEHDATGRSYDDVADQYAEQLADELSYKPLDRALLAALIEEIEPGAKVADVGCGPGHVASHLASLGAEAVGIDLSSVMVELGRRRYPAVGFRQGDMLALPADDGEFAAVVAFYSIIHLTAEEVPAALAELRRALRPAGALLLAFHAGEEVRHRDEWWGRQVDLDFRFHPTDTVVDWLEGAGFAVDARIERRNYPQEVETRRAYLLAHAPGGS